MHDKLLAGRHILVVEDHMMLLRMLEGMLVDLGCSTVKAAATVAQALALLETQNFDAVTLDVNLNGIMSFPVADVLAERGVPFMFVTGYGESGLPEAYQNRPTLTKPFRYLQAAAAMEVLLPLKITPAEVDESRL